MDIGRVDRRAFMRTAVVAGVGVGIVGCTRFAQAPFMSIGICDPAGHTEDFAAHGYAYIEPAVQRFLVPNSSEAGLQGQLGVGQEARVAGSGSKPVFAFFAQGSRAGS